MSEYVLQERLCSVCTKTFKVLPTSKQEYCSKVCLNYIRDRGLTPKQKAKKTFQEIHESYWAEVNAQSNAKRNATRMTQNIVNAKKRQQERDTKRTEKKDSAKEKSGQKKTEEEKGNTIVNIINSKETLSLDKLSSRDVNPTPCVDYEKPSGTVRQDSLASMSLIDNTANHLLTLMKGVTGHETTSEGVYDPMRVNAACNCAKQIYLMMQSKIQINKLLLEIER